MACLYTYVISVSYPEAGPDLIDQNHVTWRMLSTHVWGVVEPYASNRIGVEARKDLDSDFLCIEDDMIYKYLGFLRRRDDLEAGEGPQS